MPTLTEGNRVGAFLKYEADARYSREEITILGGAGAERKLAAGTVLGKITASGKHIGHVTTASDGTENASGVLLYDVTAPNGVDVKAVAIVRHAIVSDAELVWPAGATTNQKNAAIAELNALGVLVRKGV